MRIVTSLLVFLGASVGGCASQPDVRIAAAPPAVPTLPLALPQPPAGAAPNLVLPVRAVDGGFVTPNRGLSAAGSAWHLRAALNVAALGCRDAAEPQTVAAYNAMLTGKKAVLATADAALRAEYRARHGATWQDAHDGAMTRLYNFFALPPVQAQFCVEARAVLTEVGTLPADAFLASAPAALARLETPFIAFYTDYARYRAELAAWTSRAPVAMSSTNANAFQRR